MFSDRRLLHIYAIIFIDVVVGSAIGPILPQFVREVDRPQVWLAVGTGLFLGVQLFSAPLLGKLSDGYGRRPILIVSAVGTFLANWLLLPVRLGAQLINRVSDGLTNGMYATVRSAITDISPKDQLFRNLGVEGAIVALAFVIGPAVSGALLTLLNVAEGQQARVVVVMAITLSFVNVLLSWTLRETHPNVPGRPESQSSGSPPGPGRTSDASVDAPIATGASTPGASTPGASTPGASTPGASTPGASTPGASTPGTLKAELMNALNVGRLWLRLTEKDRRHRGLKQLILMQLALTLSIGYYNYFVTYVSFSALRLDARNISYLFMYFGTLSIVINYVFYAYVADRINQRRTIVWLAGLSVPILVAYGLVGSSLLWFYVLITIDCLTVSLIQGLLEGLIAKRTTDEDRGEVFGISQAMQGLASLGTTVVFGALSLVDLRLPFAWFAVCLAMVAWLAGRMRENRTANAPLA